MRTSTHEAMGNGHLRNIGVNTPTSSAVAAF
jgi:hypothetical protein